MGEVIVKRAARGAIMQDVKTTKVNAGARVAAGEAVWAEAERRLSPVIALYDATEAKLTAARLESAPLTATVEALDLSADDLIKSTRDTIWNLLGRPANDPFFELLFPGGTSLYADAPLTDQPALMHLLADLLEAGLDVRLAARGVELAAPLRAAAERLEAAIDAARKPAAKLNLYGRMLTAIARSAQLELANLKRTWRASSLSEADIHTVIPDRPRSYGLPEAPNAPNPTEA